MDSGSPPLRREGVFVALWTPTDAHGHLLETDLKANLRWLAERGVHGLLALGSTGEFLHLEVSQRKRLLELVVEHAQDLPVIANISDVRPRVVAELGRFARQIGAAAIAVLAPHFYPLERADLVEFFVRAAEASQLPLFLYNFPERTGNRISPRTILEVAQRVPLAGVKQSGGEFEYHRTLAELGREHNFVVLTGGDTRLPEAMALGAVGCVSGLANAVPEPIVDVFEAVKSGEAALAAGPIELLRAMETLTDQLCFPLNVAAAMQARRQRVGAPKSIVSASTQARYEKLVVEFEHLYEAFKLDAKPAAAAG